MLSDIFALELRRFSKIIIEKQTIFRKIIEVCQGTFEYLVHSAYKNITRNIFVTKKKQGIKQ